MTLIETIRNHPRVEHVDDRRASGNGVVVTLRQGYTFDRGNDTRTTREDKLGGAIAAVRLAHRFAGPYTK